MVRTLAAAAALFLATQTPAQAEAWALVPSGTKFQQVADRDTFVSLVSERSLRRFGIRLNVLPDGRIDGRAFGRDVTGAWAWRDGYFCREMAWGSRPIAANCQEVTISGNLLRFTSDRGEGAYADLRLR